ncbi:hypothetical protein NPIL_606981 [Nephila pilipes]|uniref:Uncharacterized protein n=1 Tax=Nephila pilipes TaxID=299642 RepID=A0A8X6NP85_NEPPI|nr:hypothetical protein NPIL_606981 [Nephila pilipes]
MSERELVRLAVKASAKFHHMLQNSKLTEEFRNWKFRDALIAYQPIFSANCHWYCFTTWLHLQRSNYVLLTLVYFEQRRAATLLTYGRAEQPRSGSIRCTPSVGNDQCSTWSLCTSAWFLLYS